MNSTKTKPRFRKQRKTSIVRSKKKDQSIDIDKYINKGRKKAEPIPYQNQFGFEDFGLDKELLNQIQRKGYRMPSEVQDKSIPVAMQGTDLIGIAGTGTGKTAAFIIPIIQRLLENRMEDYALIIAPTRELASQINDEFRSLTKGMGLFSTCLIGGISVRESLKNLSKKNHIIIGTPGRLQDMAGQGALDYTKFEVLVLDEFDRMLDMGFSKEILRINGEMSSKDQTLLFSATYDKAQEKLIKVVTTLPEVVRSSQETQDTTAIDQSVVRSQGRSKADLVKELLTDSEEAKTILFCETKRHAEKMSQMLKAERFRVESIHGDKSQRAREVALRKFRRGQVRVLVATDVVARGIDVTDVELVINYQAPRNYSDYVHRIGRTGRAGKSGRAVTLV